MRSKPFIKTVLVLAGALLLFGCSQNKKPKSAEVRIGQFLLATAPVEVIFTLNGNEILKRKLTYGTLSGYEKLKPATYTVRVKSGRQLLLKKKIGLGTGGCYTFCLTGMPVAGQEVNQQSTKDKLHHIVEGAEGATANGYLPQLLVLNDFFESAGDKAKIRLIHLAPRTVRLSAKIEAADKSNLEFSGLEYPRPSESKTISPGPAHVKLKLDGGKQELVSTAFAAKVKHLYTYFVIADTVHNNNHLQLLQAHTLTKN